MAIKNLLQAALELKASKFHMFRDKSQTWRWHLKSSNGNIIATSGEGYANKADCLNGIEIVKASTQSEVIED